MWRHLLGIIGFVVGPLYAAGLHGVMAFANRKTPFEVRTSDKGHAVRVYKGAKLIPKKYMAITSWNRVYARPEVTVRTMVHEFRHIMQVEEMGFLKNAALYGYWLGRVGYDKHPFEQDARLAAGQPLR